MRGESWVVRVRRCQRGMRTHRVYSSEWIAWWKADYTATVATFVKLKFHAPSN